MTDTEARPTLDDVARHARVSTATVSRCINSPDRVSKATRERVDAAINALGYTPNFAARFMAAKRTFTIGAVIPTMANAVFAQGLQAFQQELQQRGYMLLVSSTAYKAEAEEDQIRNLVARGADGLLLIGHERSPKIYDYLRRQNVPVLVAWSYDQNGRVPSIGFDNRAAMRALAEKVIGLGHKRIGMISGVSEQNDRARLRVDGVRDAMAAHGLDPNSLNLVELPYGIGNGEAAFNELMHYDPRPSVVLCGNDVLAVGSLRGAYKLGLSVPRDISITGFDDIELAQAVNPQLTTVQVPHRLMGKKAARELVGMVEEKRDGVSLCLETKIVDRESVASPAEAGAPTV